MRTIFKRFCELVLVDCTHKTNKFNYQLCTFMVMDEFGHGQVVQQSLFETNGDWHMEKALDHLKRANPDAYDHIRVVMVDKDLNEVKMLVRTFPNASVLLCHFHVVKFLATAQHKPEFGRLSADDHSVISNLVHRLIYASSDADFSNEKVAFLMACDRLNFTGFADYMDKNWFKEPERWVMCMRSKLPHLKNHTNNRLESWFGKFKSGVDKNSTMAQCVKSLLNEARRCQHEYEKIVLRQGCFHNPNYDQEMLGVLRCSTPFVAKFVETQYTAAVNKFDSYKYEVLEDENCVIVTGSRGDHVVDLNNFSCDCEFSLAMRLPCRHAIAYRKKMSEGKNDYAIIPLNRVDMRWQREAYDPPPVQPFVFNKAKNTDANLVVMPRDARERYNEAMRLLTPICSEFAAIDDEDDFRAYIQFLKDQFRNVRKRKRTGVEQDNAASLHIRSLSPVRPSLPEVLPGCESEPEPELSQANSLWSAEVGNVHPAAMEDVHMESPTDLVVDEAMLKSPGENMEQPGGNLEDSGKDPDSIPLNFNENAPRTGRPKTDRATMIAEERQERVRFNAAEATRRATGELTLLEVIDALDRDRPDLDETARRLAGVQVKFKQHEKNRPIFDRIVNPVLNQDAYYILPPRLLQACVDVLPMGTRFGEVIDIRTPDAQSDQPAPRLRRSPRLLEGGRGGGNQRVDVVRIAKVGIFSCAQIETMRRVEIRKKQAKEGIAFAKWLRQEVASTVPVEI